MDTGSMTNWIARALLEFITYSTKGHIMLEVITMTGRERKRFELVEVSYNRKQKAIGLICYVYNGFTEHVTVGGLPQLLQGQSTLSKEQYVAIVDPASTAVDHADLSLGIGLIMCPASISKILSGPIMHFNEVNLSLNPTIFGLAISGEVPRNLKDKVKTITNQCTIALPVCNHGTVPKLAKKLTEPLPKTESHKEKEFIDNGHQVSIAINSTKIVSPLAPVVSPMHFMLFIGALMLASAYSNVLGCCWVFRELHGSYSYLTPQFAQTVCTNSLHKELYNSHKNTYEFCLVTYSPVSCILLWLVYLVGGTLLCLCLILYNSITC